MMKRCTCCKATKPRSGYTKDRSRRDGLNAYCRECLAEKGRRNRAELRAQVLAELGGRCVRCGYDDERALQVDHVHGNGRAEREAIRNPRLYYLRVLADATGRYQLLCANCNQIKKTERGETASRWPITIT